MAATKPVDPDSFIAVMCDSPNADLISDSLKNDLVAAVFVHLPKLVPNLKGGYFATKANSTELDELCFEPKVLPTTAQLAQLYPSFRSAKSMPFFTVPGDNEHVKGVKVTLRKDKALNGGTEHAPVHFVCLFFCYRICFAKMAVIAFCSLVEVFKNQNT